MDSSLITTAVFGLVGIGITIYYSMHTKKLAHEQMLKQLFTEFNQRYDKLNNYLNKIENLYPTIELLDKAEEGPELKQKAIDYFSLCAEEFFWYHHKGRIDPLIWESWQSGMNYWYNNVPSIRRLWEQEVAANGKASYYITDKTEFFSIKSKN